MRFFASLIGIALAGCVFALPASASTTVLCEGGTVTIEEEGSDVLACAQGELYGTDLDPADTVSGALAADSPHGEGSGQVRWLFPFESEVEELVCTASSFSAGLKSSDVPVAGGTTTNLTFGGCTTTIPTCSVTSLIVSVPINTEAEYVSVGTAGPNGLLRLASPTATVKFSCAFGLLNPTCTYQAGTGEPLPAVGDLYNPGNGSAPSADEGGILDVEVPYFRTKAEGSGSSNCPLEGVQHATYSLTAGDSATAEAWIGGATLSTKLCATEPFPENKVLTCKQPFAGVIVGSGLITKLNSTGGPKGTITCWAGFLKGQYEASGAGYTELLRIGGTVAEPSDTEVCESSLDGKPNVDVAFEGLPFESSEFEYKQVVDPQGKFWFARDTEAASARLSLKIKAGKEPECSYALVSLDSSVRNGFESFETKVWRKTVAVLLAETPSEAKCPSKLEFDLEFWLKGLQNSQKINIYLAGK